MVVAPPLARPGLVNRSRARDFSARSALFCCVAKTSAFWKCPIASSSALGWSTAAPRFNRFGVVGLDFHCWW